MALTVPKLERAPHRSLAGGAATTRHSWSYSISGLRIRSDVPLPIADVPDDPTCSPNVEFVTRDQQTATLLPDAPLVSEERCFCPAHDGNVVMRVFHGPAGTWLWNADVGMFHIQPDGQMVSIYPNIDGVVDYQALALNLCGFVTTFILHRLGYPSLHASTVVVEDRAIVFVGPKGHGKSTMAATFLRKGATLLTDDVLPLHLTEAGVQGLPSLPIMKLWNQSARHALALADDLPGLLPGFDKKLLTLDTRFPFADRPARIAALYLLNRYEPDDRSRSDISIRPLGERPGLMTLISQTSLREFLQPAEIAPLLPLYSRIVAQAPVRLVSYPNGFEYGNLVYDRILDDVRGHG